MDNIEKEIGSIVQIFSSIEDRRHDRGKRHRLIDIFVLSIFGILWGHTDFVNMVDELKYHEDYFKDLLGLKHGIPSHDVFSAVFRIIDPEEFLTCFIQWIYSLIDVKDCHLCLDGKAIRAACDKVHNKNIPYIVNAYLVDYNLLIGQIKVDEKTNEIKGVPELLKYLDLKGVTVTLDAMGCQRSLCDTLVNEKKADYVIPAKANQENLQESIIDYFQTYLPDYKKEIELVNKYKKENISYTPNKIIRHISEYHSFSKAHGRLEDRNYYVSDDISFIDKNKWPTVKAIAYTCHKREIISKDENDEIIDDKEKSSVEIHAYILSRVMDAQEFASYVRGHWSIENSLHYVLDVFFDEDLSTSKKNHTLTNLSLLRKTIFNLINLDPIAKKKSKKAAINYFRNKPEAVIDLLFKKIPESYITKRNIEY